RAHGHRRDRERLDAGHARIGRVVRSGRQGSDKAHGMTTELLTIEHFSDKIGQAFVIEETDAPAVELTLTEAKPLRNFANAPRAPFSLVFTSRGDFVLAQRMYPLRHPALGLQSIFLVPIGRNGEEVSYEAVFN